MTIDNYNLIRFFSITLTSSHLSNNETEKNACMHFKNDGFFNIAVNDNYFTCIENLFTNTNQKKGYVITNSTPEVKDLMLLERNEIEKVFIITPSNKEKTYNLINNLNDFNLKFEIISLEDKIKLIENIKKDTLINFKDSSKIK